MTDRYGGPEARLNLGWNMYGVGIESMGRDGKPEELPVGSPGPDQLLIRVDAVGLCYSDVKLLRQGGDHPKLYGRDLAVEPTRLGHEATVTVIEVGSDLTDRYRPGQRLVIQPDIHVGGRSTAYGYTIPGGLIRFHLIGPEVLDADDGAYVIDVDPSLGYAAAALSEPWACVEAAYTQRRRLTPMAGGTMWIMVGPDVDPDRFDFEGLVGLPGKLFVTNLKSALATRIAPEPVVVGIDTPDQVTNETFGEAGVDDIILVGVTSADMVSAAARMIAFRGTLNLVGDQPLDGRVAIDLGRIHYHYTAFVGSSGPDVCTSYGQDRNRAEIQSGGVAVFVGAGGPMGQMHIQRAIESSGPPRVVVASDLDDQRLEVVRQRLAPMAKSRSIQMVIVNPADSPGLLEETVRQASHGKGADDVIVTVPAPKVMAQAGDLLADDGMLVLFAGVPNGSMADVDLSKVFLGNAQFTGTSGSSIADQRLVLAKALDGALSPERSLAAVGGIEAARDGVQAMLDGSFAGKIVIFPQLQGLGLTGIAELGNRRPGIGATLIDGDVWTVAAEQVMIDEYLAS